RVTSTKEGPRYCVACHITEAGFSQYQTEYLAFRSAMQNGNYDQLDFQQLRQHFGQNSGNQMNSPLWVHMVAGLGTGLFLFDGNGGAINPLDQNPNRYGIFADPGIQNVTVAPATAFDPATFMTRIAYNLDSIVLADGTPTSSSNHPLMPGTGPSLRAGTPNPTMAGPLTGTLIDRLTNPDPAFGIHLDSWLDANGNIGGNAGNYVSGP
ncbi:MAG: hypothetical protein ACE10D_11580, partial [Planctomycetota bacterium]